MNENEEALELAARRVVDLAMSSKTIQQIENASSVKASSSQPVIARNPCSQQAADANAPFYVPPVLSTYHGENTETNYEELEENNTFVRNETICENTEMGENEELKQFKNKLSSWLKRPIYVTLDGAQFDDLPRCLNEAGFDALPLFLEHSDYESRKKAPRFVVVDQNRLHSFLEIPGIVKGGVFWKASGWDKSAAFQHFQQLVVVRTPVPDDLRNLYRGSRTRAAVFRYFDPSTLRLVLPFMAFTQRSQLFGHVAKSLLIDSPTGMLEAKRQTHWPNTKENVILFSEAQINEICLKIEYLSHKQMAAYLRETIPDHAEGLDDKDLVKYVERMETIARTWGLKTQNGFKQFCWLQYMSEGQFARSSVPHKFISGFDGHADTRLDRLLKSAASFSKSEESPNFVNQLKLFPHPVNNRV